MKLFLSFLFLNYEFLREKSFLCGKLFTQDEKTQDVFLKI